MERAVIRVAFAMLAVILACGCEDKPPASAGDDAETRRPRVFAPPPGQVRPVPPHAIRDRGVGPYLLGEPLKDVLTALPHGPRVELLKLDGIVDYSLVRAEGGRIIVGVKRPEGVSFIAVVDAEVARTESGVGVGSTAAQLEAALGAPVHDPKVARDPRLRVFASLPNVTFVMGESAVAAVVVTARVGGEALPGETGQAAEKKPPAPAPAQAAAPPCPDTIAAAVQEAAGLAPAAGGQASILCAEGKVAAAIVNRDQVVAVSGPVAGKLKRTAASPVPGLVFAGLIDVEPGFPPEIAAVSSQRQGESREARLTLLRSGAGGLNVAGQWTPYRLAKTAWLAVRLEDTSLLLEVAAEGDRLDVGGFYVHWQDGQVKTVAPLLGERFTVRSRPAGNRGTGQSAKEAASWPDPGGEIGPAPLPAIVKDGTAAASQDARATMP